MNSYIKKKALGQYFTKKNFWLKNHILDFIYQANAKIVFDPFAGAGDLLRVAKEIGFTNILGYDIDKSLGWEYNDSLINIPRIEGSIIITNPPYLTNYSARRKGIFNNVEKYFNYSFYDDIYQIAIDKCMENNDYGVMIIPESFINSNYPKHRLQSITIIEDVMFYDTENPICVICFDKTNKSSNNIKVYKNDDYIGNLGDFEKMRKIPNNKIKIKFNTPNGKIALRAVDTTKVEKPIKFLLPNEIDYDLSTISESSRLITLIDLKIDEHELQKLIKISNEILFDFRRKTNDILLTPFKGNKKNGERRRRLDYQTARAILEEAYESIKPFPTLFNNN